MPLRYAFGPNFNALSELYELYRQVAAPPMTSELDVATDVLYAFQRMQADGFAAVRDKWSIWSGDRFLYKSRLILVAISVPGQGRGNTFDVTLLGAERIALTLTKRGISPDDTDAFHSHQTARMETYNARLSLGQEEIWT